MQKLKAIEEIPAFLLFDKDASKGNVNIINCFFKTKADEKHSLFHFTKDGLKVNLDGYAIIPLEEYNKLNNQ